jgi:hypothetical protein
MFGRRSHLRFIVNPASDGVLRIVNDVVVQETGNRELFAISRDPGIVGEVLDVQIMTRQGTLRTTARIAESRPLVADGAVRHRLRLERMSDQVEHSDGVPGPVE